MPVETETQVAETTQNDRTELEATVDGALAKVFSGEGDDEVVNLPADTEEVKETPAEKVAEEVAAETEGKEETEETPAAEAEKPAEEAAAAETVPTLPAAYRRSLKAYEWTDEEIDNAMKANGDQFLVTAKKMHDTRSKELQSFAALGRASKQGTKPQEEAAALPPVDVEGLKKTYGADEALIAKLAEPVNAAIQRINQALPRIKAAEAASQQQQLETFGRQLDTFFASSDSVDTYGKSAAEATDEQLIARTKVVELADAVRAGARQQGRNLSFDEALQMATDATTTVTKTATARKEIAKTLQTRARAVTLKPSSRSSPAVAKGRAAVESKVAAGLGKVFS